MKKFFTSLRSKMTYLALVPLAQISLKIDEFIPTNFQTNDLADYVRIILSAAFGLAGVVAVFYLIWGGYTYITSGGGETAENAKKTITNAIIGLIIIIIAFALVNFVWNRLTGQEYGSEQLPSGNI